MSEHKMLFENLDEADEISYLMSISNRMYDEALADNKRFDSKDWDRIKEERERALQHVHLAYNLMSDIANLTYKLRHGRN